MDILGTGIYICLIRKYFKNSMYACMHIHTYTQRVRSRTADCNFLTLRVTTI